MAAESTERAETVAHDDDAANSDGFPFDHRKIACKTEMGVRNVYIVVEKDRMSFSAV